MALTLREQRGAVKGKCDRRSATAGLPAVAGGRCSNTTEGRRLSFLGNYRKTPFGLHRGDAGTFMFVVEGRKRIRAWPDEFFRDKEDMTYRLDYEPFLQDSIVLEGGPGDVLYWPSGYWHIGEDAGELTAAISVALFMTPKGGAPLSGHVATLLEEHLAKFGAVDGASLLPRTAGDRAPALEKALGLAKKTLRAVVRDRRLAADLRVAWLNHATGSGFATVPAPRPSRTLADADVVRGEPDYPIVWVTADDDEVICSANGHAFAIAANPNILKLLERLNTGVPCSVKSVAEEYAGSVQVGETEFAASRAEIRALLERLHALNAVTVDGAGGPGGTR